MNVIMNQDASAENGRSLQDDDGQGFASSSPSNRTTWAYNSNNKIAICGYGYRLPAGLHHDNEVWDLLAQREFVQQEIGARYGIKEVPWDGLLSPQRAASPYEGLMSEEDAFSFDCALFGMSRKEADRTDPQIKLLLQATWEALESAGYSQVALHNSRTGVFCGHQTSAASGWRPPFGGKSSK